MSETLQWKRFRVNNEPFSHWIRCQNEINELRAAVYNNQLCGCPSDGWNSITSMWCQCDDQWRTVSPQRLVTVIFAKFKPTSINYLFIAAIHLFIHNFNRNRRLGPEGFGRQLHLAQSQHSPIHGPMLINDDWLRHRWFVIYLAHWQSDG